MKRWMTAVLVAGALGASQAQVVSVLEFEGQVTMNMNQSRVRACGVRFIGTHDFQSDARSNRGLMVDGSLSIFAEGAVVKGGQYRATIDSSGKHATFPVRSRMLWLRVGDGPPMDREQGVDLPTDQPGFNMFTATSKNGVDAMTALLSGATLRVSFEGENQRTSIFSGKVNLKDKDRDEFLACIQTLLQDAKAPSKTVP